MSKKKIHPQLMQPAEAKGSRLVFEGVLKCQWSILNRFEHALQTMFTISPEFEMTRAICNWNGPSQYDINIWFVYGTILDMTGPDLANIDRVNSN